MRKEISCGFVAMVEEAGRHRVLLVQQASGNHWTLCKGHIEPHDGSHLATAKRELLEETNLTIDQVLFDAREFRNHYRFERKGDTVDKTNIFFCGLIKSYEQLKLQASEILDHGLFTFDEAIAKVTFDTDRQVLKDVERTLIEQK